MKRKQLMAFLAAILIFQLVTISQTKAQTNQKDIVVRSGFTFSNYSDEFSVWYQSIPDPVNIHQTVYENSTYYFTPGAGKFLGKGYYLGAHAIIGQTNLEREERNENQETVLYSETQLDRLGGGILFRKYFTLSDKVSPFVGFSTNFYREKGTTMGSSGQSVTRKTNYIASEIQVGLNYMIFPRLGLEAYYSPGQFYGEKNDYSDNDYDFEVDFGKNGQEFSFGINYHLVKK
ncbi:hypothetical protein [Echinicola rosea]|uniref:Outer membrane protein beta-barrel domain-containing protein n=1 Tax=Echinicola rosea TaxID=1807691 RepID=A0ABQ1V6K1_9BACT|nr:hypothetical protein [Echinicola rosea]GGF39013.1 hypothetical protein GCM10011339_29460 [Echinicola rosea]